MLFRIVKAVSVLVVIGLLMKSDEVKQDYHFSKDSTKPQYLH